MQNTQSTVSALCSFFGAPSLLRYYNILEGACLQEHILLTIPFSMKGLETVNNFITIVNGRYKSQVESIIRSLSNPSRKISSRRCEGRI